MYRLTEKQKSALSEKTLEYHQFGKIEIMPRKPLRGFFDLSKAYTPGVGKICELIAEEPEKVWTLTNRSNSVAIISDGTAVLGLGDLGPVASLPILEGKAVLMRQLAGVDGFPLTISPNSDEIEVIAAISDSFGAINLEDIAAPRCFEIDTSLRQKLNIPVMHDDQAATAVVVLAGLKNALRLTNRELNQIKVVMLGAGASGLATANLLLDAGVNELILFDSKGPIFKGRSGLNQWKKQIATRIERFEGEVTEALEGADAFIGLSVANALTSDPREAKAIVERMSSRPILFCLANPNPEIPVGILDLLDEAIIATGRSDRINQLNNVLAFPGIFRGALDVRATEINSSMLLAASEALTFEDVKNGQIIPHPLNLESHAFVAELVAQAAMQSGVAQIFLKEGSVFAHTRKTQFLKE